jgi:hypothetical protein
MKNPITTIKNYAKNVARINRYIQKQSAKHCSGSKIAKKAKGTPVKGKQKKQINYS